LASDEITFADEPDQDFTSDLMRGLASGNYIII
jgi:hypothetical protein